MELRSESLRSAPVRLGQKEHAQWLRNNRAKAINAKGRVKIRAKANKAIAVKVKRINAAEMAAAVNVKKIAIE
jgi:hypothetical protein